MSSDRKSAGPFRFALDRKSARSPEQQLVAHFKIAVMMGDLKPGDQLPSVRALEKDLGVGRNVVWRAYSKLAESGTITIESRRRAVVNNMNHSRQSAELVHVFGWLANDVLERVRALRINPRSFQRYLTHRIQELDLLSKDIIFVECNRFQAQNWSAEIGEIWNLPIAPHQIQSLRAMAEQERGHFRVVLTPLYHHDEVSELFPNPYARVIPLRLRWDKEKIYGWSALPAGSRMALVLKRSECAGYGDPFAQELHALCPNLRIEVIPFRSSDQVNTLLRAGKYAQAFLSGSVQESLDAETRNSPLIARRALRIDRASLEDARLQAGVVL